MPGFDGTGPAGQGPMTGRGAGYCALPVDNNYNYPVRQNVNVPVAYPQQNYYYPNATFYNRRAPRMSFFGRGSGRGAGRRRGRF